MADKYTDDLIAEILTEARFEFALKCLETAMRLKKNKNIIFSPYSIYEGLLLAYLASSGDTESQLRQKLGLPDHISIQKNISKWILHNITEKRKKKKKLLDYNEKNICWITNTQYIKSITQCLFKGELEVVGFHRAYVNLKHRINELLRIKTKGYICKPVELNCIYGGMEMILSSILCLKGNTVKRNNPTDAHKMHSLKEPRSFVSKELNINVTELPLADKNLSLFLLFPLAQFMNCFEWPEYGKMSEMIDRLTTRKGIDELRRILESSAEEWKTEEVTYPDFFEIENELDIEELLNELCIRIILKHDDATLTNFTDENLHLGGAKHRAYIKVTQENVTAGAINMYFTLHEESFNPSSEINHSECTKKFLWLIYCRESRTILFIGTMNEKKPLSPTKERKGFFDKIRRMFH